MKQMLFVLQRAPYVSTHSIEILEAAMVAAVFDANTSLLFRGDGVWSLIDGQDATPLGRRTIGKMLSAMPSYEIEQFYVCSQSLHERGLEGQSLLGSPSILAPSAQAELIQRQDAVISMP